MLLSKSPPSEADNSCLINSCSCIAISGLASHPFGSWKQRDEGNTKSNFMWLRDQLPRDLKQIRSILYGYDTKLLMSESFQTVEDLALSFIARLDSIGRSSLSARPLVVLAHSLGGIVLKRALVEMANGNTKQNFMLDAIRMVILFGVPNRGMRMSHLLPMVEGKPNTGLVEILSQESTYLTKLDEQFNGITLLRKIRLVSVIETARTRVPVVRISPPRKRTILTNSLSNLSKESGPRTDPLRFLLIECLPFNISLPSQISYQLITIIQVW